ncbi:MAG: Crp/Fnr family transcriptional regulator [Bacteroidota bacterium]
MHPFRVFISNYTLLSEGEWKAVEACLERKRYHQGESILECGRMCRKLYFLESGFLRYYYLDKNGSSISKFFTIPPYCFTSQRSFTQEIPAQEGIEALEDSIIWEMSKKDAYTLFKYSNWSQFVRKLVQEVQFYTEQILEEIQSQTAEERYFKMIEEGDILLEKVPLKHLASYLGIAPQSLSRIRKKYALQHQT